MRVTYSLKAVKYDMMDMLDIWKQFLLSFLVSDWGYCLSILPTPLAYRTGYDDFFGIRWDFIAGPGDLWIRS